LHFRVSKITHTRTLNVMVGTEECLAPESFRHNPVTGRSGSSALGLPLRVTCPTCAIGPLDFQFLAEYLETLGGSCRLKA
jgi:hypothetical protein